MCIRIRGFSFLIIGFVRVAYICPNYTQGSSDSDAQVFLDRNMACIHLLVQVFMCVLQGCFGSVLASRF